MSAPIAATDFEVYDDEVLRLLVDDIQAAPLSWTYQAIIRNLVAEVQWRREGLAVIQGVLERPNGCHQYEDGFHVKDCPGCDLLATVRHARRARS